MKQKKTSKEFQNDMACIVLCARKIFTISPSKNLVFFSISAGAAAKISGMAVALSMISRCFF
jgi:hypothetical protein